MKWQHTVHSETFKFIKYSDRHKRLAPIVVAAGVALISGVAGTAYYFKSEMSSLNNDISELQKRQNELLETQHDHTRLMKTSSAIMCKLDNNAHSLKDELNDSFDSVDELNTQLDLKQQIHMFLISQLIISKLEKMQNVIYALKMHQTPHISFTASLNLYFMDDYLRNMSDLLPPNYMIPQYEIADELLLDPSFVIMGNTLKIDLRIPIVLRKEYKMMKLIPVPMIHEHEMLWIEPSHTHIAIHIQEARIIPFPEKCQIIRSHLICVAAYPTVDNDKLNCELNLYHNATAPYPGSTCWGG